MSTLKDINLTLLGRAPLDIEKLKLARSCDYAQQWSVGKVRRKDTLTKGISSQFTAQFQGGNHVLRLWAPCLNNIAVVWVHEKDMPRITVHYE